MYLSHGYMPPNITSNSRVAVYEHTVALSRHVSCGWQSVILWDNSDLKARGRQRKTNADNSSQDATCIAVFLHTCSHMHLQHNHRQ